MGGKNHRTSTKEERLPQAKDFAEDWYLGQKGKLKCGELKVGRTFKEVAIQFRREFEIITEGQRSPIYVKGHERRLRLHLVPFFGDITPGHI